MSELLSKARKSTVYVLPAQIIIRAIGLAYMVLIARGLSVEAYGIYNFVVGALLVFGNFSNLGIASSLQRFLPEYAKLEKFVLAMKTIIFAHVFRLLLSIIVLGLAYLTFDQWSGFFNIKDRSTEFWVFAIGAFILFQIEYIQIEFNSLFMHKHSSLVQVLYSVIRLALVAIVLFSGYQLVGVLAAEAMAYLVGLLVAGYLIFTRLFRPNYKSFRESSEKIEFSRILKYSGYNALVMPGGILYSHSMDYFVIAAMANPFELGLYALASRTSKMLVSMMPQNILQSILRPAIYHHYYSVENQKLALRQMFRSLTLLIAVFLFPAVALIMSTAEPLIRYVFGSEYTAGVNVFLLLVFFNLFTLLEFPSDMILQAIEKVEIRAYAQIFAVYNIIAAIALMPIYGILGVAFATGSALMLKCLYFFYMARRYSGIVVEWPVLLKIGLNSVVASIVGFVVISLQDSAVFLALAFAAGFVVYALMTYINNPMNQGEKVMVNQFLKRRVFNV